LTYDLPEDLGRIDKKRRRLLACVDRVLTRLGPDVRRALVYYMRREYSLKHYEIPDKPREFSLALHHVFGRSSKAIEREITQLIIDEFHLERETELSLERVIREVIPNLA